MMQEKESTSFCEVCELVCICIILLFLCAPISFLFANSTSSYIDGSDHGQENSTS